MGISTIHLSSPPSDSMTRSHYHTHKAFLLCNYLLLGASSSCIFLTLSLRLLPSPCGLLLILLHALTIAGAVSGCAAIATASSSGSSGGRWYGAHMVATVLAAIFQGSVAVFVFTRTADFLAGGLKSYVREDDGVVILRMVGGLSVLIFCLEWVVLALAFVLRYYAYVEGDGMKRNGRVQHEEETGNWPFPFQV